MALRNTKFAQNDTTEIIQITQDSSETGSDGRVWRDLNNNIFWIADDFSIGKKVEDATSEDYSSVLSFTDVQNATLCINKDQDIIYCMYENGSGLHLQPINISDMSSGSSVLITASTIKAYQCIIDNSGKIWYLTDDKYIHRSDIDGSNHSSVKLTSTSAIFYSFGLTTTYEALLIGGAGAVSTTYFRKVGISGGVLVITESWGDNGLPTYSRAVGTFIVGDYAYFLCNITIRSTARIIRLNKSTTSSPVDLLIRDLVADYSISGDSVTLFFTDSVYGYFYENNETTRRYFWRVTLSDLSCVRLAVYNLPESEFKWNTGSDTIQNVETSKEIVQNCDPAGFSLTSGGATGGV